MKTEKQIRRMIAYIEESYADVLTGALITETSPPARKIRQFSAEVRLETLYYILGEKYESKLTN